MMYNLLLVSQICLGPEVVGGVEVGPGIYLCQLLRDGEIIEYVMPTPERTDEHILL